MTLNLVFLGPPGAGKGSVAMAIAKEHGLVHIPSGDLVRDEVDSGSELGKKIEGTINAGNLVSAGIVENLIEKKLQELKSTSNFSGFILDGFPRFMEQAQNFEGILSRLNEKLTAVIYIESSEEQIVKRLSARWHCSKCEKGYNTFSNPPKVSGRCDVDDSPLERREDDRPETVKKRYKIFLKETMPVINYYEKKGLLKRYDGNVPLPESIAAAEKIVSSLF